MAAWAGISAEKAMDRAAELRARGIFRLLGEVRRVRRLALLVVTHEVNRALLSADRIAALRDGTVVREGRPEELANEEALESVYGRRFLLSPHPETGRKMIVPRSEEAR